MANKRRSPASSGKLLEMTRETLTYTLTASSVTTLTTVDLDLLPDEIAEVRGIESILIPGITGEIDGEILLASVLSTDPGTAMGDLLVSTEAIQSAQYEDLEVFFMHRHEVNLTLVGVGANLVTIQAVGEKTFWFPENRPFLVGSNIGWNVGAQETANVGDIVQGFLTVFFTRRRATVTELNQILLKRR